MFNNNKVNMVFSLIIAVVLWLYVAGQVDPRTDKDLSDIRIQFTNTESLQNNGLDFASASDAYANVTIEGKRAQLNRIESSDIKVTADLEGCDAGKNTITLRAATSKKADIDKISPATITVYIEKRVARTKHVEVEFMDKSGNDKEPGNVSVYPEHIDVYGAETVVDKVDHLKAAVPESKFKSDGTTVNVKPIPVDDNGKRVKNVHLSQETVQVTATMMQTKDVHLSVETTGQIPDDKQLEKIIIPKKVRIKGTWETLNGVTEITAQPVDISGVEKSQELPLDLNLPEGVTRADKDKNLSVKVILKELASQTFDVKPGNFEQKGPDKGYSASVTDTQISVTVTGTDKQIEKFRKNDLHCSLDLEGLKKGRHQVDIDYTTDSEVRSVTFTPDKVRVKIEKDEKEDIEDKEDKENEE